MLVYVAAHFKNSKYKKNSQDIYALDIITDCIEFLESKVVVEAHKTAKAIKA